MDVMDEKMRSLVLDFKFDLPLRSRKQEVPTMSEWKQPKPRAQNLGPATRCEQLPEGLAAEYRLIFNATPQQAVHVVIEVVRVEVEEGIGDATDEQLSQMHPSANSVLKSN